MIKNSKAKRGAKNVIYGLLQQLITLSFGLLLPRLFLVSYGSEINGLVSSVTHIYVYIALLEAGVGTATLQALYRTQSKKDYESANAIMAATNQYYKRTGLFYLFAIIVFAITYPLFIKTEINTLTVISIIILNGLGGCISFFFQGKFRILLQAEGKSYILSNLASIIFLLNSATKILLIQMGFSIIIVQMTYFILCIIQMVFIEIYVKKHCSWLNLNVNPDYASINQKNSVLIHKIAEMVFSNTDILILTLFCGLKIVSVYTMFITFYNMIKSILYNFLDGLNFNLGQTYHENKIKYERMFDIFEIYYMALTFALYTILHIFIIPFMKIYTRGIADINYIDLYLPILFTTIYLLQGGRGPCSLVINHAEHFSITQWRSIVEAIINLVVSLILVNLIGIYGVLIGTIAALFYRANDIIIYTNKKILERSPLITYRRYFRNLFIFLLFILIDNIIKYEYHNYLVLLKGAILASLITLTTYVSINAIAEKEAFRIICKRILMITSKSLKREY